MLKYEKLAISAAILYVSVGYVYEFFEDTTISFYSVNSNFGNLVYWTQLRASALLAFISAYYYTKEKHRLSSYVFVSYGITHFINELIGQLFYSGESENDNFALVVVLCVIGFMIWKKREKN